MTEVRSQEHSIEELRRSVLREVFEALSGSSSWRTDDRFEHYPLDVQAIAQLTEEQCQQKLKQEKEEVLRKLKLNQEKAIKEIEHRCAIDKQALGIEAEADRKQLGIEITRVKKRLIEAEREKHQATCEKAQAQRDTRNLRNDANITKERLHEAEKMLKKKTEELNELKKGKFEIEKKGNQEIQRLNENILNLETKLNNQQASWEEKQLTSQKASEMAMQQIEMRVRSETNHKVQNLLAEELKVFQDRIERICKKGQELSCLVENYMNDQTKTSVEIPDLLLAHRREIEADLLSSLQVVRSLQDEKRELAQESEKLAKRLNRTQRLLNDAGYLSLEDLLDHFVTLKDETENYQKKRQEQEAQIEELSHSMQELTRKEENAQLILREISAEVENLQLKLKSSTELQEDTKQRNEILDKRLESGQKELLIKERTIESLTDDLERQINAKCESEEHISLLQRELTALQEKNEKDINHLKQEQHSARLSIIKDLREKWFGDRTSTEVALGVLKECLCDATTNSGVRALKMSSKLRGSATPKRKQNSAMQCSMGRVRVQLERILAMSDLEQLLANLKSSICALQKVTPMLAVNSAPTSNDETQTSGVAGQLADFQKDMLDFECCLFWTILDARFRRQLEMEEKQSRTEEKVASNKVLSNSERKKTTASVASNRLRTEQRVLERKMNQAQTATGSQFDGLHFFKDKEAEEILEIISVLKGYLQKEQSGQRLQSTP